jgi:hypothetical protein
MKKKAPAAAPAKAPAPPAKTAAPPQADATPAPTPAPEQTQQGVDFSQTPAKQAGSLTDPIKPFKIDPAFLPPPVPGLAEASPDRFKLTFDPPSLIDWSAMRQPFLTRGVQLGGRDADMMEHNWVFSYNQMVGWGLSPELAAKVANIGTPLAYDFSLSRDYPTTEEKMDQDIEKRMGPGKKLGKFVVPIITPDTLNWIFKTTLKKDIDFRF